MMAEAIAASLAAPSLAAPVTVPTPGGTLDAAAPSATGAPSAPAVPFADLVTSLALPAMPIASSMVVPTVPAIVAAASAVVARADMTAEAMPLAPTSTDTDAPADGSGDEAQTVDTGVPLDTLAPSLAALLAATPQPVQPIVAKVATARSDIVARSRGNAAPVVILPTPSNDRPTPASAAAPPPAEAVAAAFVAVQAAAETSAADDREAPPIAIEGSAETVPAQSKPVAAKSPTASAPTTVRAEPTPVDGVPAPPIRTGHRESAPTIAPIGDDPRAVDAAAPAPVPGLPAPAAPANDVAPAAAGGTAQAAGEASIVRHLAVAHDGQWLDSLARDIAATGGANSHLRFQLNPPRLGALTVQIAQESDGAAVRLTAESDTARDLLIDAQPRLLAEARAQGLTLAHCTVDAASASSASQDKGTQPDSRNQPNQGQAGQQASQQSSAQTGDGERRQPSAQAAWAQAGSGMSGGSSGRSSPDRQTFGRRLAPPAEPVATATPDRTDLYA